jgi:hypothetical protein
MVFNNHPPLENMFPTFSTAYFHVGVLRIRALAAFVHPAHHHQSPAITQQVF